MSPVSPAVRSDLAPTGTLRVGINHGNLVLAQKNPTTGDVKGVAVDMAHELGRRLEVPVVLVQYTSAGQMTDAKDLQAEGKMDKAEGSARKVVGDVKDAVKHATE